VRKVVIVSVMLVLIIVIIIPTLIIGNAHKIQLNSGAMSQSAIGKTVAISVYMHEQDSIIQMDLEEYVKGVVAAEMPAEFELEALKSQAVAARTYAVKHMRAFGGNGLESHPGADISTDYQQSQAWLSQEQLKKRWGSQYILYWEKVSHAVEQTKGLVLTYNGEFINAVFHSTSGQYTASAKEVWGYDYPYLQSVPCPWDQQSPRYHDRKEFSVPQIEHLLGPETQVVAAMQNGSGVTQILEKTDSGRVATIRIGAQTLSGLTVRDKLELRSTNFTIEMHDDKMIFNTTGYGHGVGLSQYGANGMAQAGHDFRKILTTFYTGVSIIPLTHS